LRVGRDDECEGYTDMDRTFQTVKKNRRWPKVSNEKKELRAPEDFKKSSDIKAARDLKIVLKENVTSMKPHAYCKKNKAFVFKMKGSKKYLMVQARFFQTGIKVMIDPDLDARKTNYMLKKLRKNNNRTQTEFWVQEKHEKHYVINGQKWSKTLFVTISETPSAKAA
jgi:hypothetical protein